MCIITTTIIIIPVDQKENNNNDREKRKDHLTVLVHLIELRITTHNAVTQLNFALYTLKNYTLYTSSVWF